MALLSATLSAEPEVDDRATRKAVDKVEETVGKKIDRMSGAAVGSAAGAQVGGTAGAVVGGLGGRAVGAANERGGLAGAAGAVGLAAMGGLVTAVTALSEASPTFGKMLSVLQGAMSLFFRPFGQALGQTLLPFAVNALQMAKTFNSLASEKGLSVALGTVVVGAIKKIPKMASTLTSLPMSISSAISGSIQSGFTALGDTLSDTLSGVPGVGGGGVFGGGPSINDVAGRSSSGSGAGGDDAVRLLEDISDGIADAGTDLLSSFDDRRFITK